MATRGQELNTRITADDQASKIVDQVASKMAGLEDRPTDIVLSAEDQASAKVDKLEARLKGLKAEDVEVVLQARADQLNREIDRSVKKLAAAKDYDGDEIAMIVRVKDQATAELSAIRSKLDSIKPVEVPVEVQEPDSGMLSGLQGKIGDLGGQLGGKLAGGLAAGFGAAAVGAVLVESLNRSWDQAAGLRTITAKFRLSQDEMAEYGRTASDVYANNWGDSLQQVQDVVATTAQRLSDVTGDELGRISEQILAVSQVWGKDYQDIIRSVSQLTQNELAGSAQEALDLIVAAFQSGGDEAGDLLDTIDEYAQHWAAMGLSGEDAMNQVVAAIQSGQRDTDKLADAVKEFRLRAVEDIDATRAAYQDLGLDADAMREAILAGGDDARGAFLKIIDAIRDTEDPIERNRLAVLFLGTQFEDLGPQALDVLLSIEGALKDVDGAAQDVADTVGEASPWDRSQRLAERALTAIGTAIDQKVARPLDETLAYLEDIENKWDDLPNSVADFVTGAEDAVPKVGQVVRNVGRDLDDSNRKFDRFATAGVEASEEVEEAVDRGAEALDRYNRKVDATADKYGAMRDDIRGDRTWEELSTALWEAGGAAEMSAEEVRELKERVIDYSEEVAKIPPEKATEILALIDQGEYAKALAMLAELEKDRQATLSITPRIVARDGSSGTSVRVDENGNLRIIGAGGSRPSHTGGLFQAGERLRVLAGQEVEFTPTAPGRMISREDIAREREQAVSRRAPRAGRSVSFAGATFIGTPDPRFLRSWARQMERELRGQR
jgi:phage-related minor tail protein